ncbi:hypothetical protein [Streptomyces sp. NPDC008150]
MQYTPAWHAHEEAEERAWLDQWAQLHLIPNTEPPVPVPGPELATAGCAS